MIVLQGKGSTIDTIVRIFFIFRQAREAVEMRAQLEKKLAQKEKEKKEQKLVELAQKAREERAGIRTAAGTCSYRVLQEVFDCVIVPQYMYIVHTKSHLHALLAFVPYIPATKIGGSTKTI